MKGTLKYLLRKNVSVLRGLLRQQLVGEAADFSSGGYSWREAGFRGDDCEDEGTPTVKS